MVLGQLQLLTSYSPPFPNNDLLVFKEMKVAPHTEVLIPM